MSTDPKDSLIKKITDIFQEFQRTLGNISHEHLDASKNVMGKIDTAKQEALREEIRKQ